jgi:hypothetical protein
MKSMNVSSLPFPHLNIIGTLWLVMETKTRDTFPHQTSLKIPEDVLQEEWYKIPLDTVQNLFEFIPRIAVVLTTKSVLVHSANSVKTCI